MKKKIRVGNAGGYWGDDLSALKRQLTGGPDPTAMENILRGITHGKAIRCQLDNLHALNFLLEQTLDGGGTRSLMIDPQGKTLAQALLQMRVKVPSSLLKPL